MNPASIALN